DKRLAAVAKADAVRKVWHKDTTYWGMEPDSDAAKAAKNRMGWLTVTDLMLEHADDLQRFGEHVKAAGFKKAVFVGSAGSSPAVEVYAQAFGGQNGYPSLSTIHADAAARLDKVDADTLYVHAGKAATTPNQKDAHGNLWKHQSDGDHYVMVTSA